MLAFSTILKCKRLILNKVRYYGKQPIPVKWVKPEIGWTKLNFDGSCKGRECNDSIRGVFRNHKAEFLLGYAEPIGKTKSTTAEIAALKRGLELALENGWTDVWLEGDAKSVVDIITTKRDVKCEETKQHVEFIKLILSELNNYVMTHVYREGNCATDKLARIGHGLEKPRFWRRYPHDEVLRIVHEDAERRLFSEEDKSMACFECYSWASCMLILSRSYFDLHIV